MMFVDAPLYLVFKQLQYAADMVGVDMRDIGELNFMPALAERSRVPSRGA